MRNRTSTRLPTHDYGRAGTYFVTVCTAERALLFSSVCDGKIEHSPLGKIVAEELQRSASMRPNMCLDASVIMPNHVHALVVIKPLSPSQRTKTTLGSFVGGFKAAVTSRVRLATGGAIQTVWQRNYYEHIVRDSDDLQRIRHYIADNPATWHSDPENPEYRMLPATSA